MANYIKGTKIQENSISETKLDSSLQSWKETVTNHINNNDNPHNITKSSIGLDNVTNDAQVKRSELGVANGVATLDSTGKVPSGQLPSYVDDVIEGYLYNGVFYKDTSYTTSIVGESGKIYIDLPTNKTYRWTGSVYGVISETIALGETSSTAYRGDRGKIAYDHSQSTHAPSNAQANVIETIKVNGTALTPNSKAVDITIPTVGNGTITIKQGGTSKGTFTTNQNGNTTIELTDTNTTYTAGDGLSLSGTTFSNNGVRSIATGTTNGTISVNTNGNISNIGVYGLKSAAYTDSSAYAAASHTHSYLPLTGGTMANTNVVTNLNADLLDGYHKNDILRKTSNPTSVLSLNDVVVHGIDFTSWDYAHHANVNNQPLGDGALSAASVVSFGTNFPFQIYSDYNDTSYLYYRSYYGSTGWKAWRQFAFLDSNVASASKWATPRTITLTGSVTGSVSIDGSANVTLATDLPSRLFQYITNELDDGNGFGRLANNSPFKTFINSSNSDCMLITTAYNDAWRGELALDYRSNNIAYRNKNNGTWNSWAMMLTTDNFSNYALPLSGGTLKSHGSDIILKLNSNMAFNAAWVEYNSNDVKLGYLGFNGVDTPSFYPTSGSAQTLLHAGNYNTYAPTLTGTGASGTWGISISGNADTLDGFHASDFSRHITGTTITTGTKYFKLGNLPKSSNSTWDAFLIQGEIGSWASTQKTVLNVCVSRRESVAFCGYTQGLWQRNLGIDIGVNNAGEIVLIATEQYCAWTLDLHTIQGTISYTGTTFTPTDTNFVLLSASNNVSKSLADGTVEKATKLQNSRTIWGQSFDGTGNVSGALAGVTNISASGVIASGDNTDYQILLEHNNDIFGKNVAGISAWNTTLKPLTIDGSLLVLNSRGGGNVGIGTASPSYKLHVNGDGYFVDNVITEGDFSSRGDAIIDGHAKVNSLKASNICIECDNSGNPTGHTSEINNYNRPLYIQYSTSNNCCICYGGGNVGIGITSPTYKLHVSGDARIDGTISCIKLSQTSDIKYKTNIKQIEYEEALKIIENLNPVTWDWNENTIETGSSSGFVAQEAEEFIPNAISRDNENNLSLDYTQLHSYEIKVIQEQQKEIKDLKQRLEVLENLVLQLTNREI